MTAPPPSAVPLDVGPGPVGRPDLVAVFRAEYRLLVRSAATRGRLLVVAGLAAVSLLVGFATRAQDSFDPARDATAFASGSLATLIPVAVLVFASGTIGDLIDDSSLVYLWLRPVPMRVHVAAAWAASLTIVVPLVLVPVTLAVALISSDAHVLRGAAVSGLVASAAYAGIFVMVGIRFRRALLWGLAYVLIWEGFVAAAGETASKLAVRSYTTSILSQETGVSLKLGDFTYLSGVLVPLAAAFLALAYAARRLGRADVA